MAILNYGNQFKYTGEGYLDSKMAPVNTVDELERNVGMLSSLYVPGMKVMVLNDEPFGAVEYFLNDNYEWKRVLDLNHLTLSLDKEDLGNDGTKEVHLQLMYKNEVVGDAIDLSVLLEGVEKRLDVLEGQGSGDVVDTNTFVNSAELVTEYNGENGIFIKFIHNDGSNFAADITALEPKTYSQGVGVLIGENNVISIDEAWFAQWFESKVDEFNERFSTIESDIDGINESLTNLSQSLSAISGKVDTNTSNISAALTQIAANAEKIQEAKALAEAAQAKANENETKVITLAEQLAKIRGVEYIKAGDNVTVIGNEDGSVTISADVPEFDTTDIENRLDVVEGKATKNAEDIISLQEALKNIIPEGEALSGDGITINTNEDGFLTVRISEQELNVLKKNNDGLYVQGVEMGFGDDEINESETN